MHSVEALLSAFALFLPLTVSPVPFVESSLDTTMDIEDAPIIVLCGEDFDEAMTMLEFDRLVDEGIITLGGLSLPSANPDTGVPTLGEA